MTTTGRKMIVSTASRIVRAISFGVFWRLAPFDEGDHPVEEGLAALGRDLGRRSGRRAPSCRR